MDRRSILPLLLVGAVLGLSGCRLDVAVDVEMEDDGSGVVTVEARADPELAAASAELVADLRLDDAEAAGWTAEGPTAEESEGGVTLRLSKPFATPEQATAILAELNGPAGPLRGITLSQQREFARVTTQVAGQIALEGGMAAFADQALLDVTGTVPFEDLVAQHGASVEDALGLTLTVRAPGGVVESTGDSSGDGVRWSPSLAGGSVTEVRAVVEDEDGAARQARTLERLTRWGMVAWGVVVVVLVVGVGLLVARRGATRPTS